MLKTEPGTAFFWSGCAKVDPSTGKLITSGDVIVENLEKGGNKVDIDDIIRDGSHLAGDRFGGSPEIDNLVSQASNVNLSQYKIIENEWANAIDTGKKVSTNVTINYDADRLRPKEFLIKYTIDGKPYLRKILN